jgi:NADH-quinone oxidoreductase subunit L
MTRQWVMVFLGEPRWDDDTEPHESPRVMTLPLVALAGLTVVGGLVNTPLRTTLEHFLEPAFEGVRLAHPPEGLAMFVLLAGLSVLAGLAGAGVAFLTYRQPREGWAGFERGFQPLWGTWEEAYRVDDIYGRLVVAPGRLMADIAALADSKVIDGAVNGVARAVRRLGDLARPVQSGFVRNYGALLLGGAVAVVIWMVSGS